MTLTASKGSTSAETRAGTRFTTVSNTSNPKRISKGKFMSPVVISRFRNCNPSPYSSPISLSSLTLQHAQQGRQQLLLARHHPWHIPQPFTLAGERQALQVA